MSHELTLHNCKDHGYSENQTTMQNKIKNCNFGFVFFVPISFKLASSWPLVTWGPFSALLSAPQLTEHPEEAGFHMIVMPVQCYKSSLAVL